MLNGEMTMIHGRAYQTKATGETVELNNNHITPFASVIFFKADTTFNSFELDVPNDKAFQEF